MNKNIFLIALLLANISSYCSEKLYPSLDGFTITDKGNEVAKEQLTKFLTFLNGRDRLLRDLDLATITKSQIQAYIPYEKLVLNNLNVLMPALTEDNFKDVLGTLEDVVSVRDKVQKVVDQQGKFKRKLQEEFEKERKVNSSSEVIAYPFSDLYTTLLNWLDRVMEDRQSVLQQDQSDGLQDAVGQRASSDSSVVTVLPTFDGNAANRQNGVHSKSDLTNVDDDAEYLQLLEENKRAALQFKETLSELCTKYYTEVLSKDDDIQDIKQYLPIENQLNEYFSSMIRVDGYNVFIGTIKDMQELEKIRDQLYFVVMIQEQLKQKRVKNRGNVQFPNLLKSLQLTVKKLYPFKEEAAKDNPSIEALIKMRDSLDDPLLKKIAQPFIDISLGKVYFI